MIGFKLQYPRIRLLVPPKHQCSSFVSATEEVGHQTPLAGPMLWLPVPGLNLMAPPTHSPCCAVVKPPWHSGFIFWTCVQQFSQCTRPCVGAPFPTSPFTCTERFWLQLICHTHSTPTLYAGGEARSICSKNVFVPWVCLICHQITLHTPLMGPCLCCTWHMGGLGAGIWGCRPDMTSSRE